MPNAVTITATHETGSVLRLRRQAGEDCRRTCELLRQCGYRRIEVAS